MLAESAGIAAAMGEHWAEVGVTGSAVWLAYVTQFPYHVRRRHVAKVRRVWVVIVDRTGHRVRWLCWQVTYFMPGRERRPWFYRDDDSEEE